MPCHPESQVSGHHSPPHQGAGIDAIPPWPTSLLSLRIQAGPLLMLQSEACPNTDGPAKPWPQVLDLPAFSALVCSLPAATDICCCTSGITPRATLHEHDLQYPVLSPLSFQLLHSSILTPTILWPQGPITFPPTNLEPHDVHVQDL